MAVTLAACGGGGGGGGGSGTLGGGTDGNGSKNKFHHDSDVGKWGSGNATGSGFGGNGGTLGDLSDIYINGNTSLDVTGYTFNGTTYSDLKEFTKAILENGTTEDVFYVNFNVNGESAPRTARIRANSAANPGDDLTIDYQYKLTYTVPSVGGTAGSTQEVFFYKRDGASINLPVLSDSVYTNQGGIDYHANKWDVQGQKVSGGNMRINATGDATISNITQVPDTSYGFRSTDNALVVNQTSGTVAVNVSGRSGSITKIELPASGSVALDLSQVTNLAIANNGVTNKTSLGSITFPTSDFTIGGQVFKDSSNLSGSIDLSHCTAIGNEAFTRCAGLTGSINLSKCTSIGDGAFYDCSGITGPIDISHSTSIGSHAFHGCTGINCSINLSSCTSIGRYAFCDVGITGSVDLSNCTSLEQGAFCRCSGISGTINLSNCTQLEPVVFDGCSNITTVILNSSLTTIDNSLFRGCTALSNINLSNITSIGQYALENCTSLSSVNISNCTSIGQGAFQLCSELTGTIDLSSCQIIGDKAFHYCSGITSIIFGSNLQSVGSIAFWGVATNAQFVYNCDPNSTSITYSADAFRTGATATWNDNGNVHTYTWDETLGAWVE